MDSRLPSGENEAARLAVLGRLGLRGARRAAELDALVAAVVRATKMPIGLLTAVDEHDIHVQAAYGVSVPMTFSRSATPCERVVATADIVALPDIDEPAIHAGPLGLRSYVGAPVIVRGRVVGALAAADVVPRETSLGTARLLTDLAEVAASLLESRAGAWVELFEAHPEPLVVFEEATDRVLAVNRSATVRYGYSHDEMTTLSRSDFVLDDAPLDASDADTSTFLERHRTKAGRTFSTHVTYYRSRFHGRPARMALESSEVGAKERERVRSEEALREANDQLRAIIDASPLAIFTVDAHRVVSAWSAAAAKMFGWSSAEILGRPLPFVAGPNADDTAELFGRVLRGEQLTGLELRPKRRDGEVIDIALFASPLYDPVGEASAVLCIAEDISRRRELEDQLRQSQKMEAVGRLAGGIAHDFNNLLTVIRNYADLLLDDLGAGDPRREDVSHIRGAADRAATLTQQLLAFSRRQLIQPKQIALNRVVGGLEQLLTRLLGEDIRLSVSLAKDCGAVLADSGQLEQVVLNLAVNARDSMPRGGCLRIDTQRVELTEHDARSDAFAKPGSYARLTVRDTGVGMDEGTLNRIFEPFFTTKDRGKGTGLGLATVYGVVRQSGGHLRVRSEVGSGSVFEIFLPRIADEGDGAAPPSSPRSAPPSRGEETVLLVEDDARVRTVAMRILRSSGYIVLTAESGRDALRLAESYRGPLSLLLTDVVMPEMDGRELAEALAPIRPSARVLYMSGYPSDTIGEHGVLGGDIHFLAKPFTPASLLVKVREVLDERASQLPRT